MNPIQLFFLALALIGGLIFYIAAIVLPDLPLPHSLFGREDVVVTASTVETRQAKWPALPVIDVRDAAGNEQLLQGYHWMSAAAANKIVAGFPVGATVEAPRWQGKLWRGISGVRDWILLIVSLFASVILLFGLRMLWKLRRLG